LRHVRVRRPTAAVAVAAALLGAALGPAGVQAAKKTVSSVLVTNDKQHPVSVVTRGTTAVKGTVGVAGTVPVTGKIDTSGSTVGVSGKLDVSGSKVDASGSTVGVTGKVDVSGSKVNATGSSVSVAHEIPYSVHGFQIFNAGETSHYTVLDIPAGKTFVITYMSARDDEIASGADLPTLVSITDGSGTGGASIYLPMLKAGAMNYFSGSEQTSVPFTQGSVNADRTTSTGSARFMWEASGYLVNTPAP
jgi:hypothetical protein